MKQIIHTQQGARSKSWFCCALFFALFLATGSSAAELASLEPNTINFEKLFSPRQGGDTMQQAVDITLPFFGSGTTVGYADDVEYSCPHTADAPDVFYRFIPETDIVIEIDLWGSQYDTQLFVLDEEYHLIDCNDNYYAFLFTSFIGELSLVAGETYFIVVDGYYEEGEYLIRVEEDLTCELSCTGVAEGEPPLQAFYHDQYNGGCTWPQYGNNIQELIGDGNGELVFCGKSGWFWNGEYDMKDVDWFLITFGVDGAVEFTCSQEERAFLLHIGPMDCASVGVLEWNPLSTCRPSTFTILGDPGSQAWLVFRPQEHESPSGENVYEFDYELSIRGLQEGPVKTDVLPWAGVKAFYR